MSVAGEGGMQDAGGVGRRDDAALLGRGRECATLGAFLADLRAGRGRVLVLEGPPGIGKTALVRWAIASARGVRVLQTRADESRHVLPYAALRELLRLYLEHANALPPSLVEALAPAVSRNSAPVGGALAASDAAVGIAGSSMLSTMAERQPVLVVIDDAQWLDPSSAYALAFAANRIGADAVAFLVAQRDEEPSVFGRPDFDVITVPGLDDTAARALIGDRMVPAVAEVIVAHAAGNPLAINRACERLTDAQRRGVEPFGESIPLPHELVGYKQQVDALRPDDRRVILVVACDEGLNRRLVAAAGAALGAEDPSAAIERTTAAGLLNETMRGLELTHPLLGSAVTQAADPAELRRVHHAIADLLQRADDVERRAWHLADSVDENDDDVAAILEEAAAFAVARGDHRARAALLARAAAMTPVSANRIERLMTSAGAFEAAGLAEDAMGSYDAALALVDDESARADVYLRRAVPALLVRDTTRACMELEDERERIATFDASRAAMLSVFAALSALSAGLLPRAHRSLDRARELDPGGVLASSPLPVLEAVVGLLEGRAAEARPVLRKIADVVTNADSVLATVDVASFVANALMWCDEFAVAERMLGRLIDALRRAAMLGPLAYLLTARAELHWRTGRFLDARADADEARVLAGAGRVAVEAYAQYTLGRAEAGLGRLDIARGHCMRMFALTEGARMSFVDLWGRSLLGFLDLSGGEPLEALTELEWAATFAGEQQMRLMSPAPWGPDLVEAYVQCGRQADAASVVARLEVDAGPAPTRWTAGALGRCRGLVADENFVELFEDALSEHAQLPTPFETARTHLCYGERLLRARRPDEAEVQLDRAIDIFVELSAAPWLERALRARGGGDRRGPDPRRAGLAGLTTKEYQVVRAVVKGATNREVAETMFVSVRTVESHLASAYRKLGVHTRTELAHVVRPVLEEEA
jgi:DNA-binding CsgD family transcriptional regulator